MQNYKYSAILAIIRERESASLFTRCGDVFSLTWMGSLCNRALYIVAVAGLFIVWDKGDVLGKWLAGNRLVRGR